MDTDGTIVNPTRWCCVCLRILSSEIETRGALASTSLCDICNFLLSEEQRRYNNSLESVENTLSQQIPDLQPLISDRGNQSRQWTRMSSETESDSFEFFTRDGDIFSYAAYESDSDASVDVDTLVNDDDDEDEEFEVFENTGVILAGRIQLNRSLATNGRNRPNDWLAEILSEEGVQNSERRRLFGILEDQVLATAGYGHHVDVEADRSPTAVWFVKNLERVAVDEPGLICVICKDNVCIGSVLNRLPCGHVYHRSCIVSWLNVRNTCPLCRYELPTDDNGGSHHESEVQGAVSERGGGIWRFVVTPLVSVVGIVVVLWLGRGVFVGQRDDRSTRWRSLFGNE